MVKCRPISTLMEAKARLLSRSPDEEATLRGIFKYQEQVGYYQWAASITGPKIAQATAKLGEFSANPSAVY